jgi:hypothetical protein
MTGADADPGTLDRRLAALDVTPTSEHLPVYSAIAAELAARLERVDAEPDPPRPDGPVEPGGGRR